MSNIVLILIFQLEGIPQSVASMASYRTIQGRLKNGYHYPEVNSYQFDQSFTITDVPADYNGARGEPIVFRWTNVMDAVVGMLKDASLHYNQPENFVWRAEVNYVNGPRGGRLYTQDLSSGHWWERTENMLTEDMTLLPIMFYADATHVTASGSQQAHPIMVSVGNLRWWIRQKSRGTVEY